MRIKNAEFVISVADKNKILTDGIPEIAVSGKSNVGKSSFINFITNNGRLAKTSKTPGRTRLLNYFKCNAGEFYLVDLPGYGYAGVSDEEKQKWGVLIEGYLQNSKNLKHVFLLLDIRRDVSDDDIMMVNYLYHYNIPFTAIATKTDKLSRAEIFKRKQAIASRLTLGVDNIILTSSLKKTGKEDIFNRIETILA